MKYFFRNDYSFGAHPDVLAALAKTNLEGNIGYGEDDYCNRAYSLIRDLCQAPQAEIQFMIGGTSANFVAIASFLRPWEAVISPVAGHINGHEVGAVEATGHKIIPIATEADCKLTPALIEAVLPEYEHAHMVKPRLVYVSDATESGMVYTKAELTAISDCCKAHDLLLFLDGARLGAALTSTANDLTLPDIAALTDAFYIGGTKNGAMMGEALVIVNPDLQDGLFRIRKQRGAVLAKGWLMGVQFEALLKDGLYFEMARHANTMAARLQAGLKTMGWKMVVDSNTNQIFPIVPTQWREKIAQFCHFEDWAPGETPDTCVIRFVTCFATTKEDVDGLLSQLAKL